MMEFLEEYRDKLYGGFLGKMIGVIHGANTEGWSYEKIKHTFGEITEYPFRFQNFCSDDDMNGPVFFMRALKDFPVIDPDEITHWHMAHTLLNYVADGHGFFWWGGYGISTENTAYENLLNGIPAPQSGSAEQNGRTAAEQIGGQIFADCWGFLCPGDTVRAADLAEKMASVTHDGNGIWGGRFLAACIGAAYTAGSVREIIEAGLQVIPNESEYALMVRDVMEYSEMHPQNWEEGFEYVQEKYGYQHYEGVCHIMPNAAVIILSLIYGRGDFGRTINIGNMCGWDTDCNVGNLGSIMGVFCGAGSIDGSWISQVNDFFCGSGVLGCLNIQTLSQAADTAALIAHRIYGREPDAVYKRIFKSAEGNFVHFEYPNAVQAFRGRMGRGEKVIFSNTTEETHLHSRCLKIMVPGVENGDIFFVYRKTYYVPDDFNDSRYDPDFSPVIYPGDGIKVWLKLAKPEKARVELVPYVKERISGKIIELRSDSPLFLEEAWKQYEFRIPGMKDAVIEETGLMFVCRQAGKREHSYPFVCYLDEWEITQSPEYQVSFAALPPEKWNAVHELPAHLTYLRGIARIQDGLLMVSGSGRPAESYTGSINWTDYSLSCSMIPERGICHSLLVRVQGSMRSYVVSLESEDRLVLKKRFESERVLCERAYPWELKQEYEFRIEVQKARITVSINGERLIDYIDDEPAENEQVYLNGAVGFGNAYGSRTGFRNYSIDRVNERLTERVTGRKVKSVEEKNSICVLASINVDMVVEIENFPKPGETISGRNYQKYFGGKGANQAVAAKRMGASVHVIGSVGDDALGKEYLDNFADNHLEPGEIKITKGQSTGMAMINVDADGENNIIVVPGANNVLKEEDIVSREQLIGDSKVAISQLEVPVEVTDKFFQLAKKHGCITVLNPAPAREIPDSLLSNVDILIPNEGELEFLSGVKADGLEQAKEAALALMSKGVSFVLVTLGSKGSLLVSKDSCIHIPAKKVEAVDTTAAGDSYVGALAARLVGEEELSAQVLEKCAYLATEAASITVQSKGAQASLPYLEEIEAIRR